MMCFVFLTINLQTNHKYTNDQLKDIYLTTCPSNSSVIVGSGTPQCFCGCFCCLLNADQINSSGTNQGSVMTVYLAICCHREEKMKTADKTAEPGWIRASGLNYWTPVLPVHPQFPHPSHTLNWNILCTHSDIPPSVCPLPVNFWTSESLWFL